MIQLRKKISWAEQKSRLELWEEHLKDPIAALAKAWRCLEIPHRGWLLVRSLLLPVVVVAMACSVVGAKIFAKDVGRALLGRRLALPGNT